MRSRIRLAVGRDIEVDESRANLMQRIWERQSSGQWVGVIDHTGRTRSIQIRHIIEVTDA